MRIEFPTTEAGAPERDGARLRIPCSFKGWLFHDGRLVDGVGASFPVHDSFEAFRRYVAASNGTFAIASVAEDRLWAAVDRLRSIPLFYGQSKGKLYLSDDAYWVREQLEEQSASPVAAAELWYMLYVLGGNTLADGVKQLQAGEVLEARHLGPDIHVEVSPYYCYLQRDAAAGDEAEWTARLDRILLDVFGRLIQTAGDRQIVVPLSGGLDSRLIVGTLKRLGVKDVLAFSYGHPENPEAQVSQYVASRLGYRWAFVSYRDWDWNDPECRRQREDFSRFSANLCCLPPILEDWYAVWTLGKRGLLSADAVFCPGHTAGFASGAQAWAEMNGVRDQEDLVGVILRRHSPRLHWQRPPQDILDEIGEHVSEGLDRISAWAGDGRVNPAALYDSWNWKERQCKRIINMVRSYEYWGYQWRVPLWDGELMDFWSELPAEWRREKWLYRKYLAGASEDRLFGLYDPSDSHLKPSVTSRLRPVRFLQKAARQATASRYFLTEKSLERVLAGSYWNYLRLVGGRVLSPEPVTAPWLLLESTGVRSVWEADRRKVDSPERQLTI